MPGTAKRPDQRDSSRAFKRNAQGPNESTPEAKPPAWQPYYEGDLSGLMDLNREQKAVRDLQRRYWNQRVQRMVARLVEPQEQIADTSLLSRDLAQDSEHAKLLLKLAHRYPVEGPELSPLAVGFPAEAFLG